MKPLNLFLAAACLALTSIAPALASEDSDQVSTRAVKKYSITVKSGKNGSVSPKKKASVTAGGKAQYVITPGKTYLIDTLTVNGAPKKGLPSKKGKSYTLKLTKISENLTISATFAKNRTLSTLAVGSQVSVVDAK
jgi:hypothetical protein